MRCWVVAIVTLVACRNREPAQREPVVGDADPCGAGPTLIVTAMSSELEPLLARTSVTARVDRDGYRFACGTFAGRQTALGVIGIGPARAADGAELALSRFRASAVVMVGIAGAVGHDLRIGDVAVPAQWSRHDEQPRWFAADGALLSLARDAGTAKLDACDEANLCRTAPKLAVGGNGVTGRRFVDDPKVAVDLEGRFGASVTDMETATVAAVAHARGVPFLGVRAVSDLVWTGRSEELVEKFEALAAHNAAVVAEQLLRSR